MELVKLNLDYHSDGRIYVNGSLWPMCSTLNVSVDPEGSGPVAEYLIKLSDFDNPFQRPWSGTYYFYFTFYYDKVDVRVLVSIRDSYDQSYDQSYRVELSLDFNYLYSVPSEFEEEESEVEPYWIVLGPVSIKRVLSDSYMHL
jgi:hypothetical protein